MVNAALTATGRSVAIATKHFDNQFPATSCAGRSLPRLRDLLDVVARCRQPPAARHRCAGFAATAAARPPSNSRWSRRCSSRCCLRSSRPRIMFFASQVLETATQDSARLIMTGQAQDAEHDAGAVQDRSSATASRCCSICSNGSTSTSSSIRVRHRDHDHRSDRRQRQLRCLRPELSDPAAPATSSSWCARSINGRCSSPASATTSPTSVATRLASGCWPRPPRSSTSLDRTRR